MDFIKGKITDKSVIKHIWDNPKLYYHSKGDYLHYDKETVVGKNKRQYKGLVFELTNYCLFIYFKPHYYFNSNLHNANDFNFYDCIGVFKEIIKDLWLNPYKCAIIHMEIGINVIIPLSLIAIDKLMPRLIFHGQNQFYTDRNYPMCKYSTTINVKGKANAYKIIKAYGKGVQFPQFTDPNTFRFELKSNDKRYIKKLGIHSMACLLNIETYLKLSNELIKEFDKVLIIDDTAKPKLSKTKQRNHEERLNPITWLQYQDRSRNVFNNNFKTYYEDLDTCDTHLKKELRKLICDKLQELKRCAVSDLYKGRIGTHSKKACVVTGLDIGMQKEDSKMLSHTGLNYYYEKDREIFEKVRGKYLTDFWKDADHKTQIEKIAHNIRHARTNQRRKQRRLYPENQIQLFSLTTTRTREGMQMH